MTGAETGPAQRNGLLAWAFALAALLYAFLVHHGIGPVPLREHLAWYEPHGYFLTSTWLAFAFDNTRRLIGVLMLPVVGLTIAVFLSGRAALPRSLALSACFATLLFCFYGNVAIGVWKFFNWRGSAVLALVATALGFAVAAPFLARSWLRLGWPLRLATYLPVFLLVVAFVCNATGTDLDLPFAISPWPAVPVFGIEVGALFVLVWHLGAALGVGGIALARSRPGGGTAFWVGGVLLGIALPPALLALGSAFSLLPFRAGPATLVGVAAACALAITVSGTVGARRRPEALRERSLRLAVGAGFIAAPLLVGQLWARWDYYWTREHLARQITDALAAYVAKEDIYPDELDQLVSEGYLDEIPKPDIGFDFLYDGSFRYRSFGTSFILEFPAPRWVECAYTPPYDDEEDDADEALDAEAQGDDSLDEAWSCPSKPPELW